MKKFQNVSTIVTVVFSVILAFGLIACDPSPEDSQHSPQEIQASDLMCGINSQPVNTVELNDQFRSAVANFSLDLFRETLSDDENSLVSPISVLLALAMTANGADGNTLSQMEQVLGGGMSISKLNEYLYSFTNGLSSKDKSLLNISNSIWFKDRGFTPNCDFLQTNANYYSADAFAAPFDDQTINDINSWISDATDGLIDKMVETIPGDVVMYLINTILFDAEWERFFDERSVQSGEFTNYKNQTQTAEFMHSEESISIQSDNATGFIKPYRGGNYSFVAILPDEGVDILDYVAALTGNDFLDIVGNKQNDRIMVALTKFDYDYEVLMNDALKAMGMEDAFDVRADLTRMGSSELGKLFISKVLHKAKISVNELGTKAGAATVVEGSVTSVPRPVILNRPFVYSIIDNATNLPLFIGTLLSIP